MVDFNPSTTRKERGDLIEELSDIVLGKGDGEKHGFDHLEIEVSLDAGVAVVARRDDEVVVSINGSVVTLSI